MVHFFRKIRYQLFTKNLPTGSTGKFSKYLLYAIGEIILVVIGILIVLKINNLNNQQILNKAEITSYQNIKRHVIEEKAELTQVIGINNYFKKTFECANTIIEEQDYNKVDSLALMAMGLSL